MRRLHAVLTVLVIAAIASVLQPNGEARAGEIWTFYTGETYLNAPEPARTLYVAGLSDTLNALADSGDIAAPWVVECTTGQHSSELTAMFDRWLTANPALLGKSAPLLFLVALRANCLR
ncbi:MAG: hypothetical protein RIC16_09575 [Rhodospirillales bacterium]